LAKEWGFDPWLGMNPAVDVLPSCVLDFNESPHPILDTKWNSSA
jgi:hypothetical protein